ncbi:MAG: ATP synthase F1 subunit delta [Cyclobacteriaceae bacterium]|nr:ATP synthase F1 subunit delta [Cyclobacteriaceae bacterium]
MSQHRIAERYSRSLLSLTVEKGLLEKVNDDINLFLKVCAENRSFVLMLKNPVIKHTDKRAVLKKLFSGKITDLTLLFFELVCKKNREKSLHAIAREFVNQYNIYKGIGTATLTTSFKIDNELREEFVTILKKISGKKYIDLTEIVDDKIIGGFILKTGDKQIDESVSSKLKDLSIKLIEKTYIAN